MLIKNYRTSQSKAIIGCLFLFAVRSLIVIIGFYRAMLTEKIAVIVLGLFGRIRV
jgi:hypothetical protein